MTQITQFPFVSVSGTPEARGRSYGQQAADRVRKSAAMYGQTLVDLGYDAMARTQLIAHFAREIEDFAPHYLEEMRGIAAGADVPFEDIVMVNARTEVVAKARAEKKKAAELEPGDGCTGALILPTRSANGNLIHGQNWDWRAECAETAIVLRRSDKANHPLVASLLDSTGNHRSQPSLYQTASGKPRIQSALARSAVSLELNHRTMVRLGLYAAQHSAGLRGLVTAPGAL